MFPAGGRLALSAGMSEASSLVGGSRKAPSCVAAMTPTVTRKPARRCDCGMRVLWPIGAVPSDQRSHSS